MCGDREFRTKHLRHDDRQTESRLWVVASGDDTGVMKWLGGIKTLVAKLPSPTPLVVVPSHGTPNRHTSHLGSCQWDWEVVRGPARPKLACFPVNAPLVKLSVSLDRPICQSQLGGVMVWYGPIQSQQVPVPLLGSSRFCGSAVRVDPKIPGFSEPFLLHKVVRCGDTSGVSEPSSVHKDHGAPLVEGRIPHPLI